MKKWSFVLGIALVLSMYSLASSQNNDLLAQFRTEVDLQGYHILSLSSLIFKPATSVEYDLEWSYNLYGLTVPSGNLETLEMFTQVHLPDGAEIKRVVAVYYDNSGVASTEISLMRIEPLAMGEPDDMVVFSSLGLPNDPNLRVFSTNSITYPVIDNRNIYIASFSLDKDTAGDVAFRCLYIAYQ